MATTTPEPLFSVADRVAVVTGGLGRLGRVYARALCERGARVAIIDRGVASAATPDSLAGLAAGGSLLVLDADVTDRRCLEEALTAIEAAWGTPDILINNAALDSPPDAPAEENGPFETYPERSWDAVMDVNAKGVFLCCQVFGSAMAAAGRGSIINISSIYGMVSPNQSIYAYRRRRGETFFKPVAYAASKSALFNLTRYLATYWARAGVRVNCLTLGGVLNNQDAEFIDAYTALTPMGRMASPEDYVGPILFLASPASAYMTGANLVIDGGWTAW